MKSLHAASSYPLVQGGAIAPFMEEMLAALTEAGQQVSVVVPRVSGLSEGLRNGVRVVGAPYAPGPLQNWGYGRSMNKNGRLRYSAIATTPIAISSMTWAVRRELGDLPDVVHLHWALPQGPIALALPRSVPVVISIHGADARFIGGRLAPLARRTLERADALVAASGSILNAVEAVHPGTTDKSFVIPHGANSDIFGANDRASARRKLGIAVGQSLVLGIGRLVKKKGFVGLVNSVRLIQDQTVDLTIIGEGPLRAELLEIDPQLNLPGAMSRGDVAMWMAAADVVAIPSIDVEGDVDSGPVVLMEAMAAGTCVVATRIGMAPDVVVDGVNGYLANSSDPAELAGLIAKALKQSDKLGQGAAATFERMGDWSRVAEDLEAVYESAIDSRSVKSR